ncbi:Protein disulfide-isomerase [Aphelenchoides besseyi]|nr:Protein disulfide-isomerase [Aphelenchoides besseyi]
MLTWKRVSLALLVLSTTLSFVSASGDVLALTESDFDSKISDLDIALVKFYAPWPDFEKAATKLKSSDPPVALIDVDCDSEKDLCQKFNVGGYPTLKIFRRGAVAGDYDGPRDAEGIVKYMRGQAGPSAKELKSVADFEKFIAEDDNAVVGFFESDSKLKDSFHKVADTERDRFRFAYTNNADVLKKVGYTDDIVVYVPKKFHNKFEGNEFKYDGNYDTDKIKNFLIQETVGLAGIRTPSNEFQYGKLPLVVVIYNLDYIKDPKGSNYWRNRVLKVAQDYKRKVFFAVSNKDDYTQDIEKFGLSDRKDSDKPLVTMLTKDGRFGMDKEFSVDNLKQFVDDVLAGKVDPFVKSEAVPEEQGDLKVAVAKNFKQLITDSEKDALIEFYAPWCGKSIQVPKYEELATKLKNEDVVIAKMDATANDVPPEYNVRGFPTLYWLPKNTKTPVQYNGGREVKDFIKYIAQHSTDGLKGYDRDGKKKKKSEL